ncbi:mitotic spindle assembly checkpoint protein MAD1-like [Watersipora subatra]|uniref:mitotic spindle assembly checkpoint protein MAD1-like n=1 Tax=Watersipora subatra TaxID=2589382 RepID=UPI00355B0F32
MDPDDNTAIIDMKSNFEKFMSGDRRKRSKLGTPDGSFLETSQTSTNLSHSRDPDILKTRTDLIYCKSRIGMLESQLVTRETEAKERALLHEREIAELKQAHDRELRGYSILKTSHERVLHRQEMCEEELSEQKQILEQTKAVYDEKIRQLQKSNLEQEILYTEQLEEQKGKCRELRNNLHGVQSDLSVKSSELSQAKEQLFDLKRKLADSETMAQKNWKVRCEASEQRVRELEREKEGYNDDLLIMSARKADLARLTDLSEENKKLKQKVSFYKITSDNIEILKEQVATLERKLNNHENLQEEVARLQVENENYCQKVKELEVQRIPEDTVVRLREAQEKEAVMLENIGKLKSSNRLLELKVKELQGSSESLQAKVSGAGGRNELLQDELERLKRQVTLLSQERDGYKKIVQSYDVDVTREVVPSERDKSFQLQRMVERAGEANKQLEEEVRAKTQECCDLKLKLEQLKSSFAAASQSTKESSAAEVDRCQLLELREKVEKLERQCEKVIQERDILEARIEQRDMQGEYDPTKTKVLHLTRNPVSKAQQNRAEEVRLLQEDNKRLRERIRVLEQNLAEAHDVTAQVEANLKAPSAQENQQLKELKGRLASSEKRYEKLMEMCRVTSLEFRQIVYQLTGYRLDVPKSKQYKLMHMYSNSPDDFLLFQESEDGELQLLETAYASTLVDLAEEHLHNQNSIPVFLSTLTIDLYKQSSLLTSTM